MCDIPDGFQTIFYTVAFVIPGFISYSLVTKLVLMSRKDSKTAFLIYLVLTGVNYTLWWCPVRHSITHNWYGHHPFLTVLFWMVVVVVSPAIIGLALGVTCQKRWLDKTLTRLGLNCVDPVPTAWDWVFSEKDQEWVIVSLKSGIMFYGIHRFASSDPSERDVFLEEVWRVGNDGKWEPEENSGGVLIKGDEIASIEFRKP